MEAAHFSEMFVLPQNAKTFVWSSVPSLNLLIHLQEFVQFMLFWGGILFIFTVKFVHLLFKLLMDRVFQT
jgi:hypothetical protein